MATRKSKAQLAAELQLRKAIVDEYAQLNQELQPAKPLLRRHDDLARIIRSWHANDDPEQTVTSKGEKFEVILGPAGMQTEIDLVGVYAALGHDKFLNVSSVTLRSLESVLDSGSIAALSRKARTGTRTITVRAAA
jgi:hypothetical protein